MKGFTRGCVEAVIALKLLSKVNVTAQYVNWCNNLSEVSRLSRIRANTTPKMQHGHT